MEYNNEDLGVKFTLPDEPTVRQQLHFRGRVYAGGYLTEDIYIRHWLGFLGLFEDWESELIPDPKKLDLDKETNPKVAHAIHWIGNTAAQHMVTLDELEKKQ